MSKIINGVASEYDFPFKDFDVRYDEESMQKFNRWQDPTIEEYKKEIERLNNIIDEFDKWLIGEKMMFYKSDDGERLIRFGETKNKWLELKGDNK